LLESQKIPFLTIAPPSPSLAPPARFFNLPSPLLACRMSEGRRAPPYCSDLVPPSQGYSLKLLVAHLLENTAQI